MVSRRHCRIEPFNGGAWLSDLASANGTRCNGKRVVGALEIAPGDLIELGGTVLALGAG